uniref:C2H2-type domain-containing protein n=1 Tax=Oryzias latipes TaxID=8090 RepID=H2LP15_ORYLA
MKCLIRFWLSGNCPHWVGLVEEHAARWQLPLPQLTVLEIALCYFARASSCFPSNCDPALQTISSLALSVFELLLFFDHNDFSQEPLERFAATFQECHLVLGRHQNLHLLQVERLVGSGGPWASPVLQAILSQSSLPQHEVDAYIGSELPIFFELRVRFLLSRSRFGEAAALAKHCIRHPGAGQHLFFLQVYLTWLHKTSQQDCLHKEVRLLLHGKDAVHVLCSLESDEKDELLLALGTAFLSQQLRRGDMYYLCDLVLVWTNLHGRLKTSPQVFLAECRQLMKSATNVKSIFPFIRVGEAGVQFCIELCANALQARLPCDVTTKSLIYKTVAALLPNDLEVCRACALLVFFQERTVESYKMVYLLYMLPDQEYHAEDSPIGNHVRFETLQVLKKDLHFDPEFWNLIALRTNCLKLMNKKVVSPVLEEIMEDRWISKYCAKDPAPRSVCRAKDKSNVLSVAKKRDMSVQPEGEQFKETFPESEESRLEYCCIFCEKDFHGCRVVAHAMFHYRRDECMFCGTVFTDDLLAMIHLSDHIEKLKRLKAPAAPDDDAKDSPAEAKPSNASLASGKRGRPRKSSTPQKLTDSGPSEPRTLRSDHKQSQKPQTPHRVNGHMSKKFSRSRRSVDTKEEPVQQEISLEQPGSEEGSSTSMRAARKSACFKEEEKTEPPKVPKKTQKEKKTVDPLERARCAVVGCSWSADISKNRVAPLYHALEEHYGDTTALQLAFRVANGKCGICSRVMFSFEHFLHHVGRHRDSPRHPCLHQGCGARFKSGMEMRRHARRHSPLQAVCCLPGCSQLFICLWALNLHEKEHFSARPGKPTKKANVQTGDKTPAGRTRRSSGDSSGDPAASEEPAVKIKEEGAPESPLRENVKAQKDDKDPKVLKNLCIQTESSAGHAPETDAPASAHTMNGKASAQLQKTSVCNETLALYSKKPYLRVPPTAYLDEKYTAMPKRRKTSFPPPPDNAASPEQTAAAPPQRQRCAKCFATFTCSEELRGHLQRQNCSKLFGFDSDEEEGEFEAFR